MPFCVATLGRGEAVGDDDGVDDYVYRLWSSYYVVRRGAPDYN